MTERKIEQKKCHVLYTMLLVFALSCMRISAAMAEGSLGEINIRLTGTVVALGCDVDPGDVDKTVVLGDWATKQLKKAGDHTHYVPFTIRLRGCTASGVTAAFTGTRDKHDNSLLALNDDGDGSSARGVGIQIMDRTQKRIPMGEDAPRAEVDSDEDVTLSFYASYVATSDKVSAGVANADSEFTLTYD